MKSARERRQGPFGTCPIRPRARLCERRGQRGGSTHARGRRVRWRAWSAATASATISRAERSNLRQGTPSSLGLVGGKPVHDPRCTIPDPKAAAGRRPARAGARCRPARLKPEKVAWEVRGAERRGSLISDQRLKDEVLVTRCDGLLRCPAGRAMGDGGH